jgi:hypothetical protein
MTMEAKLAEEAIKAEIGRLELVHQQELVQQISCSYLIKKLEAEIYVEDVRRRAFQVVRKRLDDPGISDHVLFQIIGDLGKVSERVFLELHKAALPPAGTQPYDLRSGLPARAAEKTSCLKGCSIPARPILESKATGAVSPELDQLAQRLSAGPYFEHWFQRRIHQRVPELDFVSNWSAQIRSE